MAWITTKTGKRINTDWFDDDEANKQRQIEENKKEAENKNFKDGDTPKKLDPKGRHKIEKIALDDSKDADYGELSGEDARGVLKGLHYDESIEMWYKDGLKYAYDVKRVQ